MDDDMVPTRGEDLIDAEPEIPAEAPRTRRAFPIEAIWEEGDRYLAIRVPVDDDYLEAHRRPGQYVTLQPDQLDPRFLVIASAPGEGGPWEFLVDRETELGASMDPLEEGATLEISPPEGPGYPADEVAGMDVLFFVTGSGIATVRPTIDYWARHPALAPGSIAIYYGESQPGDFAYRDRTAEWSERGHEVFLCDERDDGGSEFRYVQHAFEQHDPQLDNSLVLVAGAPIMKRRVVEILVDRGVPLDRIVTNV